MNLLQNPANAPAAKKFPFAFDVEALLDSGPLLGSVLIVMTGLILAVNHLFTHVFNAPPPITHTSGATYHGHYNGQMYTQPHPTRWNTTSHQERVRVTHYAHR